MRPCVAREHERGFRLLYRVTSRSYQSAKMNPACEPSNGINLSLRKNNLALARIIGARDLRRPFNQSLWSVYLSPPVFSEHTLVLFANLMKMPSVGMNDEPYLGGRLFGGTSCYQNAADMRTDLQRLKRTRFAGNREENDGLSLPPTLKPMRAISAKRGT